MKEETQGQAVSSNYRPSLLGKEFTVKAAGQNSCQQGYKKTSLPDSFGTARDERFSRGTTLLTFLAKVAFIISSNGYHRFILLELFR